ncbi:TetR/AcrR family transcriptional regulator [Actinotignum sp. GS-2025f]|uniref:TetR/AcrR family transcriptional regulator n=1 Tax=Actinotignum sp. GS-2025e TaxID=3427278 RepID=UPI003F46D235
MERTHGRKVGRKQRFNADDVIRAAKEVGVFTFTMSDIASKIGVATPAVYRLYDGRQDIVDAVVRRAADETPIVLAGTDWHDAIEQADANLRRTLDDFVGLGEVLLCNPKLTVHFARQLQGLSRALEDGGFSHRKAVAFAFMATGRTILHYVTEKAFRNIDLEGLDVMEKTGPDLIPFLEDAAEEPAGALDGYEAVLLRYLEDRER